MTTPVMKSLKADPDVLPPIGDYQTTNLTGSALKVWDQFVLDPPYWWNKHDLMTAERYCVILGIEHDLRGSLTPDLLKTEPTAYVDLVKLLKSISIELKSVEYSLGLTPQAKAALKLTDSSSAATAKRMSDLKPADPSTPMSIESLE